MGKTQEDKTQAICDRELKKMEAERERLEEEAKDKAINLSRDQLCVLSQLQLNGPARLEDLSLTSPESVNIEGLLTELQRKGLVEEDGDGVYSINSKKYDRYTSSKS